MLVLGKEGLVLRSDDWSSGDHAALNLKREHPLDVGMLLLQKVPVSSIPALERSWGIEDQRTAWLLGGHAGGQMLLQCQC